MAATFSLKFECARNKRFARYSFQRQFLAKFIFFFSIDTHENCEIVWEIFFFAVFFDPFYNRQKSMHDTR